MTNLYIIKSSFEFQYRSLSSVTLTWASAPGGDMADYNLDLSPLYQLLDYEVAHEYRSGLLILRFDTMERALEFVNLPANAVIALYPLGPLREMVYRDGRKYLKYGPVQLDQEDLELYDFKHYFSHGNTLGREMRIINGWFYIQV